MAIASVMSIPVAFITFVREALLLEVEGGWGRMGTPRQVPSVEGKDFEGRRSAYPKLRSVGACRLR